MKTIYLDHNATTPPAPEVVQAMLETLEHDWANPSSMHRPGQAARRRVDLAREEVARLINSREREILFCSCGTEAANLAVLGSLEQQPDRNVVVTSKIEHSAVRELCARLAMRNAEIIYLPNDDCGVVDIDMLSDLLRDRANEIAVVSIMWANNETGVVQPIETIGSMCHERGVRFHTDATQWVGKMPTDVTELPVDLMNFAAHKFHGPKGIGALYIRTRIRVKPQVIGGHQERELRGGTENVPGIVGMGVAARLSREWLAGDGLVQQTKLRDRFEREVLARVSDTSINGAAAQRVWNTSNIAFHRLESEAILMLLSERGVCASGGSACASGSLEPSPVIQAMNAPDEIAHGSIRFSISRETTSDDIDAALAVIEESIAKLRKSMAAV